MKKILKLLTPLALLLSIASCDTNISNSNKHYSVPPAIDSTEESVMPSQTPSVTPSEVSSVESSVPSSESSSEEEYVDFTSNFERSIDAFDNSKKLFEIVTVKNYVDGDTTHFNTTNSFFKTGTLSARYNGVDTPESTGQVEPWGKYASEFTKGKLSSAKSIIIESDNTSWNADSSGNRYMLWVWYQDATTNLYRLLNLELVQEGLSIARNFSNYSYGDTLQLAYYQAQNLKLRVAGKEKDPNFYYGDALSITMKELRTNMTNYVNKTVRVEGLITKVAGNTCYAEDFDEETQKSYGIQVYSGYENFDQLKEGNRVSFCGTITYYETGGTYQLSGLHYYAMRPNHKDNLQLIEEGVEVVPTTITASGVNEEACSTYVKLEGLKVKKVYTTTAETSSSIGAMTLTCEDTTGTTVTVRTSVLYEEDGTTIVTSETFLNKTIDCVGIVDAYSGDYQVHVYLLKDFVIK